MKLDARGLGLEECWQQPKLSDITVLIIERGEALLEQAVDPKDKVGPSDFEEAKHVVPCSRVILATKANYFGTLLLSDMYEGGGAVSLVVGEGEADSALAVLQTMYTERIAQDVTAAELVTMWKIADRLQATFAFLYVKALCAVELDWDTAVMVRRQRSLSYQCCILLTDVQ
jgi:hypothetical protein